MKWWRKWVLLGIKGVKWNDTLKVFTFPNQSQLLSWCILSFQLGCQITLEEKFKLYCNRRRFSSNYTLYSHLWHEKSGFIQNVVLIHSFATDKERRQQELWLKMKSSHTAVSGKTLRELSVTVILSQVFSWFLREG